MGGKKDPTSTRIELPVFTGESGERIDQVTEAIHNPAIHILLYGESAVDRFAGKEITGLCDWYGFRYFPAKWNWTTSLAEEEQIEDGEETEEAEEEESNARRFSFLRDLCIVKSGRVQSK